MVLHRQAGETMTEGGSEEGALDPAEKQQARAEEAMRAISGGADPAEQAFRLSNEFTDRWTAIMSARVRDLFRRGRRD